MNQIKVTREANDQRADRFIHKIFNLSKGAIQKIFRQKRVKKNKKPLKASDRVYEGDILDLYFQAEYRKIQRNKSACKDLDIVFENKDLLIMYKEPGLLSHASKINEDNLRDRMINYLVKSGQFDANIKDGFVPALANRLDRNTAGLVIAGKSYKSLKKINELLKEKKIKRFYTALVFGEKPNIGNLNHKIKRDEKKLKSYLDEDGVDSKLKIENIQSFGDFHRLKIQLVTGRTHQIRFQLKEINSPIVGDPKYGNLKVNEIARQFGLRYQFLIADELIFPNNFNMIDKKHIIVNERDPYKYFMKRIG